MLTPSMYREMGRIRAASLRDDARGGRRGRAMRRRAGLDSGGPRRSARERRLTAAAGGGLMGSIEIVLTILVVALLWVAAVAFGRDSREDGDRRSAGDRPLRL